jgi:hypothetical protein
MLFRGIFGIKPDNRPPNKQTKTTRENCSSNVSSASKKIITSDEGEYIDYIEIKD